MISFTFWKNPPIFSFIKSAKFGSITLDFNDNKTSFNTAIKISLKISGIPNSISISKLSKSIFNPFVSTSLTKPVTESWIKYKGNKAFKLDIWAINALLNENNVKIPIIFI